MAIKIQGGVDANVTDSVTEESLDSAVLFAKEFAIKTKCITVVTGVIDLGKGSGTLNHMWEH